MERTFIAIKPDGVQRGLIAEIISRFERKGWKLVAVKSVYASKDLLEEHYAEHKGRPFLPGLVNYMMSGMVVAMIWEGTDIIKQSRRVIGATRPGEADLGSIRGDFAQQVGRNLVHGSDAPESAKREMNLWFTAEEQGNWEQTNAKWILE